MKAVLPLLLIAVVAIIWMRSQAPQIAAENARTREHALDMVAEMRGETRVTPARTEAAAADSSTPVLTFGGKIVEHGRDGILVHCTDFIRALPKGYTLDDIQGDFLLVGYPAADQIPDEYHIAFRARHAGMAHLPQVFGGVRTIQRIVYVSPEEEANSATPARFKSTSSLNQPRR